jgi:hypothetical protein
MLLAEAGIGLAGFTGIVIAISSDPSGWNGAQRFRTKNLLFLSLLSVFLVFILFGFSELGMAIENSSRSASLLILLFGMSMLPRGYIALRKAPEGSPSSLSIPVAIFIGVTGSLNIGFQVANILHVLPGREFLLMYFGMVWMLLIAGVQFFLLVFSRPREGS